MSWIPPHRHFVRIAWAAVALACVVIVFGGFVRLSNAGLSCPDWPTCYGKATWPVHGHEIDAANEAFPQRPVESPKAWREQFHRHIAATLGVFVLALAWLAARQRAAGSLRILIPVALIAVAIPLYMQGQHAWSAALTITGELALLWSAWRWSNSDFARLATITLAVIVFQATLGLWTVSWLLKPVVVMAHLLGGLTTFALLLFMAWRATPQRQLTSGHTPRLRRLLMIGLALLVAQIALGGWTSSNYAALACGVDYPRCLGSWLPPMDFREGFVLWRGIGVDYEGGVLDGPARAAIHFSHRWFAWLVAGYLAFIALLLLRSPGMAFWGVLMLTLLVLQMGLGISNVVFGLPLWVATAHLGGALALLALVVTLLARLRVPRFVAAQQGKEGAPA